MRQVLLLVLALAALNCSSGQQMPNLDNVGDILKSLKDSGMMDKFEQDLKQMLFDQKEAPKASADKSEDDSNGSSEPAVDVYEFIKAYVTEKKIKLHEKVMLYLMELPIKDELHVHLARLTGVVDIIAEISKLNKKQVDNKVVDTVKRIKSLSVMRNSLEKILSEAAEVAELKPEPKKTEEPKKVEPKKAEKPTTTTKKEEPTKVRPADDEITGAIVTFLEMIKARPDQMIDVLTTAISAYELVSPQTLKTATMYSKAVAKSEYFDLLIDSLIGWVEGLGETEFGKKIVDLAPSLIQAKTVNEVVEILTREFDKHKDSLVALAQDPATKNKAVTAVASFINSGINYVQSFVKDDMKMTFVNTFLLTQGFPSINSRKIVASSMKLIDKAISIFTPWDVDVKKHEAGLSEFVKAFEDNYIKWSEYYKLSEDEQVKIMVKFVNDNLVDPSSNLIVAQQFIAKQPECGEAIMCSLNERMKTTESKLKSVTTRGLSMLAAWAWSMEGTADYGKLYKGIWSEDCDKKYPDKSCHIFPWQSSLKIDHVEL